MKPIKPSNSLDPKPLRSFLSERRGSNMTSDNQKKKKKVKYIRSGWIEFLIRMCSAKIQAPVDKYRCGVFCFDSNNLLAITCKPIL